MAPSRSHKKSATGNRPRKARLAQNARPLTDGQFDTQKSRIKALNDWNDEDMMDDEDQFFAGNDKVLLEQTNGGGQLEHDLDIPRQLLDLESDDEDDMQEDEIDDEPIPRALKQRKAKPAIDNTQKGRFGKKMEIEPNAEEADSDSDSNDDPYSESQNSSSEDDKEDQHQDQDEEEDEETWKSYHVTRVRSKKSKKKPRNDPDSKAEEEERRALELEEVQRLQVKARSKLTRADFMSYLDYASDSELAEVQATPELKGAMDLLEFSPQKFESEPEAIAMMLKTKPEVLALVDDFQRNLITWMEVKEDVLDSIKAADEAEADHNIFNQAVGCLQYHVLSTYLSTAAFYLHLSLKSPSQTTPVMGEVMLALLELRTSLNKMDEYGLTGDSVDEELEDMSDLVDAYREDNPDYEIAQELKKLQDDNDALHDNDQSLVSLGELSAKSSKKSKSSRSKSRQGGSESSSKEKKRKRSTQSMEVEDPNLALSSLPKRSATGSLPLHDQSDFNDFIEPTSLTASEGQQKSNGKRDLRFYTAKIDAKGKRREKAIHGLDGNATGDSDLPYHTKEARRREFLQNQDHGQPMGSDDESGLDPDVSYGQDTDPDQSGDYHDTIRELKRSAKVAKKAKYDEQRLAERNALSTEAESGGPRQATRQILKNKGLTPKRAKVNRNPRVKKRLRFDKANKKISSQRPTYKSDQAAKSREMNGYSGEKSGVKSTLVKSRKL
ncbi:Sas10 C-terminal domain-containing protein [Melampsora americana]|nr:Sas10 C-terminal domain-containing protein [Melampsora americana]